MCASLTWQHLFCSFAQAQLALPYENLCEVSKLGSRVEPCSLSAVDELFTADVRDDLVSFQAETSTDKRRSVLLFPPVSNRRRFLIHRCAEELDAGLATFSLGFGEARRTVVCHRVALLSDVACSKSAMGLSQTEHRSAHQLCQGAVGAGIGEGAYRPAPAHLTAQSQEHISRSGTSKQRRPDRAVYVPRARRSAENGASVENNAGSEARKRRANIGSDTELTATGANEQTSPTEGKSQPSTPRKSLDRNYCNIYTPPHLRNQKRTNEPLQPPPISSHEQVPSHGLCQVPNSDSAISFSDNSCNCPSAAVYFSDNSNLNETPSDSAFVHSFSYAADCSDCESEAPSFIGYNERNSNFYANNFNANESAADYEVSELNMSVPNPNETLEIIDNDPPYQQTYGIKDEDIEQSELRRASQEINRSNRRIIKQTFDSDVLVISDPIEPANKTDDVKIEQSLEVEEVVKAKLEPKLSLKREENDWDAVFDDDGECLDPTLLEELTSTVGKVHITKPKNNYDPYVDKGYDALNGETFGHVVEVYGFPTEFKTNDLLSVFSDYKDTGFEIKWVDDSHALIVFSSAKIAAEVMSAPHPMVRCRPLRDATPESRNKAKKSAQYLQPYRQRPETCTALARRLVSGALGVKLSTARQERAEERRLIGIAREKKRQAALHKEAAWDGSLADTQHVDNT